MEPSYKKIVSPDEIVDLFWMGAEDKLMPFAVRNLEATDEQVVAEFIPWYDRYQAIITQDECNQPPQERDIYPPAESVVPAILTDYAARIQERKDMLRARRERFESLAQRHVGKDVVYREGRMTLFVANFLRFRINEGLIEVAFRICLIDGLPFIPPIPICDFSTDGASIVSGTVDSLYFDELRWYEPNVDWSVVFDDAVVERVRTEAKRLANVAPKDRFVKLDAILRSQIPDGGWPIRTV
jgi:hypothetical protein